MIEEIRMPRMGKKKVAIVGFCGTSRDYAPYDDPEFEVWGLNRGVIFMKRADRWFDMHSPEILEWQQRRPHHHLQFLRDFPGPVYLHQRRDDVPNSITYPLKEIADFLGQWVYRIGKNKPQPVAVSSSGPAGAIYEMDMTVPAHPTNEEPYLSSSIAYEIALAIYEGFEEIHLYGIDLNTDGEYQWQKPGVEFLLGVAAGRGIKVVLPDNCPLLRGTLYGRGYMSEEGEKMGYPRLEERLRGLQQQHQTAAKQLQELSGMRAELAFIMDEMVPGVNHEKLEVRRKTIEQSIANVNAQLLRLEGMIKETAYWLHQTMDGQDPQEAIKQIVTQQFQSEGPQTDAEVLLSEFPNPEQHVYVSTGNEMQPAPEFAGVGRENGH